MSTSPTVKIEEFVDGFKYEQESLSRLSISKAAPYLGDSNFRTKHKLEKERIMESIKANEILECSPTFKPKFEDQMRIKDRDKEINAPLRF
jgi:hypothetical protein